MTEHQPILHAQHVAFAYPGRPAVLEDVEAALLPGKLTALIGPNAAGKTTLLRVLLGQLAPTRGQVQLCGQPVHRLSPLRRAGWLSYVPQHASANFAFTVQEVVAMGRHALTRDDAAVAQAIVDTDLAALAGRIFLELSAGQQQRVLLARALAQAAGSGRAMLLDEPTSALDLWHVHQTMRLLRARARAGLAVLAIVHDLNLAAAYADEVWLLHERSILARGSWEQVLTPAVLEPVYRVRLRALAQEEACRPLFQVVGADTIGVESAGGD